MQRLGAQVGRKFAVIFKSYVSLLDLMITIQDALFFFFYSSMVGLQVQFLTFLNDMHYVDKTGDIESAKINT